jgi:tetratricopeptide (TPR) repeat protein
VAEEDVESALRGTDSPLRSLSQLLREVAASPRGPQVEAWKRGFRPGEIIADRFVLRERLGRGGFGRVFRAEDRSLKRAVAFKAIPPGGQSEAAIAREAEIAANLQHENIVRLYDFGRCESGAYLILELVSGETLAERLRRGPLSAQEAVAVVLDVSRALVYAHGRGVLHRDLKPENVLLPEEGPAKVTDFGLSYYFRKDAALEEGHRDSAPDDVRGGTEGYMPPEQVRGGREDARTDIFAVGVLLRVMITGERPWSPLDPRLRREERNRNDLANLIARASDPDPARRPRSAEQLVAELSGLRERFAASRVRRRNLALGLVAAAFLALAATIALAVTRMPTDRVHLAVADIDNVTGDPELDAFSNLLSTSLEQWRRLSVLTRDRIIALAPQVAAERGRVDCTTALIAANLANPDAVVVCGQVDRSGDVYRVQLELVPIATRKRLALTDSASKSGIQQMVDRLSEAIHRKLQPLATIRPADPARPIGPQTTPSLEAYEHYFRGQQCADRPAHGQDCSQELREALRLDPDFALAAYELAIWLGWNGGSMAEQRALIQKAEALADRAPEKTRTMIHAWSAHLDGKDSVALGLLEQVSRIYPDDKDAFYQAGDILRHRDELAASIPWFEHAIRLDPDFPWAIGDLARVLGALKRTDQLRGWMARWQAASGQGALHGVSVARGWLGDVDGAIGAANRLGVTPTGLEDLLQAKLFKGDYASVEAGARQLSARGSPVRRLSYYGLAALEMYQGRPRAGVAQLDELARELPEVSQDALYRTIRADFLVGTGELAAVWAEIELARRLDPRLTAEHAVSLAYLGDLEHAAILAQDLQPGTALARTYEALVRIRLGDTAAGLADLRKVVATSPVFAWRVSPMFLLGEQLANAGRDAEAIEVFRQAQALYVPVAMWRSWAYPRSLFYLARSYERLGRHDEARTTLDRLLKDWYHAEAGAPLVRDARRLAAHLPPY